MTALATTSNCVSLWLTDPASGCTSATRAGSSAQISGFGVSALAFHPCMESILVASMDGMIHFVSTSASSPCVTTGCVSLPSLCSSALKATSTLFPPPTSGCSKLTSERVSMHAAALRAGEQTPWGSAAKAGRATVQPEITEWCSGIQRVLGMRFVASPLPADSNSLQGQQTQSSLHGCSSSAERPSFPEPWRLVVITGTAALTLNPAGMILSELNPFGPNDATSALKSASANCNVRVAHACSFMAGACAIAPTCVRFTRPCGQAIQHRSSKQSVPSSKVSNPVHHKPSDAGSKATRSFVGHSLRLPLSGSNCGSKTGWETLEGVLKTDIDAGSTQQTDSATAQGVMCVVAGEFGAQPEALWLRGNSGAASCSGCC